MFFVCVSPFALCTILCDSIKKVQDRITISLLWAPTKKLSFSVTEHLAAGYEDSPDGLS